MGWARLDAADGSFASFKVQGVMYNLRIDGTGAVTKNNVVWIPNVGSISQAWVHIAVVLDPAGGFIRVTKPDKSIAEVSIPPLMLDSTTDIANLGGDGSTSVHVRRYVG